ncbi:MAG TPA: hypothetical protein VF158_04150 [Longimicrobiales bacterium]
MARRFAKGLLWLFIIDLGIAFGAGVYEARIVVPEWIITAADGGARWSAEAARGDDTGRRFWVAVTTVPLTLLTLGNLIAAWRATGRVRRWWLGACAAAVADRVFTFSYFIPTMIGLMQAESSPAAVSSALQWAELNHVRHLLVLTAWLAALRTFSLVYRREGEAARAAGVVQGGGIHG